MVHTYSPVSDLVWIMLLIIECCAHCVELLTDVREKSHWATERRLGEIVYSNSVDGWQPVLIVAGCRFWVEWCVEQGREYECEFRGIRSRLDLGTVTKPWAAFHPFNGLYFQMRIWAPETKSRRIKQRYTEPRFRIEDEQNKSKKKKNVRTSHLHDLVWRLIILPKTFHHRNGEPIKSMLTDFNCNNWAFCFFSNRTCCVLLCRSMEASGQIVWYTFRFFFLLFTFACLCCCCKSLLPTVIDL